MTTSKKIRVKPLEQETIYGGPRYADYTSARYCLLDSVVVLPWNTEEGRNRLLNSPYNHSFFRLAHTYQPQKNPFYCGVASMVIALNALRLDTGRIPSQNGLHFQHYDPNTEEMKSFPYRLYSQLTFLDEETDTIKPRHMIAPQFFGGARDGDAFDPGLCLHHVRDMLKIYEANVQMTQINDDVETGMQHFCDVLTEVLLTEDTILMVNFDGSIMGIPIGGHFAVVAAYDNDTDTVLLLDPAAHKTPWYWVPREHLYYGMDSWDSTPQGRTRRGYLLIKDPS